MLSTVLPWEWILENVLDLQEFSLPCLKELIGKVPHIQEPRCSKLLQKVALRYLEEIVLARKVDSSTIPLVRFIMKPQGVYHLRRTHSLNENDLLLRVETEAVLSILRDGDFEVGRDLESFEDAVERTFPEDTCEPLRVERRNELISLLLVDDGQDKLCEHLLQKYSLQELLRDLLQFVEDKKKLWKTKFLDQLAKDVRNGSYVPSQMPFPPEEEISFLAPNEDISGDYHVPKVFQAEKSTQQAKQRDVLEGLCLSMSDCDKVTDETGEHVTGPATDVHRDMLSPLSSVAEKNDMVKTGLENMNRHNCDGVRKKLDADDGFLVFNLRSEMALGMAEVDKVALGLSNQINDLVNDIGNFAAGIHSAACIPCSPLGHTNNDGQNQERGSEYCPTSAGDSPAYSISEEQSLKPECPGRRAEVEIESGGSPRVAYDDQTIKESSMQETRLTGGNVAVSKVGSEGLRVDSMVVVQEQPTVNPVSEGTRSKMAGKRPASQQKENVTSTAKKQRHGDMKKMLLNQRKEDGECIGVANVATTVQHEGNAVDTPFADLDNSVLQTSPLYTHKDERLSGEGRPSIGSDDTTVMIVPEDDLSDGTGERQVHQEKADHSGIFKNNQKQGKYLKGVTAGAHSVLPVCRRGSISRTSRCWTCRRGGVLLGCNGCTVSIHQRCLEELGMKEAADEQYWSCPCCVKKQCIEALEKIEEVIKRAKAEEVAVRKKVAVAIRTATVFLGAAGKFGGGHQSYENTTQFDQTTSSIDPISANNECKEQGLVPDSVKDGPRRESGKASQKRMRNDQEASSTSASSGCAEKEYYFRSKVPVVHKGQSDSGHSPLSAEKQGSLISEVPTALEIPEEAGLSPPGAKRQEAGCRVQVTQENQREAGSRIIANENGDTAGNPGFGGSPVCRQESMLGPSSPVTANTDGQKLILTTAGIREPLGRGLSVDGERCVSPVKNEGHTGSPNACVGEGEEPANVGTSRMECMLPTCGNSSPVGQSKLKNLNPGLEDGDGHDGDLEDVGGLKDDSDGYSKKKRTGEQSVNRRVSVELPDVEGTQSHQVHPIRMRYHIPGVRRKNKPWTSSEVDALKEGVQRYSNDGTWGFQWRRILEFGYGKFDPSRTAVDLKDKWRNISKCSSDVSS